LAGDAHLEVSCCGAGGSFEDFDVLITGAIVDVLREVPGCAEHLADCGLLGVCQFGDRLPALFGVLVVGQLGDARRGSGRELLAVGVGVLSS
jgi:hypothetical protein